jgi:hypothetical protein
MPVSPVSSSLVVVPLVSMPVVVLEPSGPALESALADPLSVPAAVMVALVMGSGPVDSVPVPSLEPLPWAASSPQAATAITAMESHATRIAAETISSALRRR